MPIRIILSRRFQKDLEELPEKDRKEMTDLLEDLEAGKKINITKLGKHLWRLKIPNWRAFFRFEKENAEFLYIERRTTTTYRKR